MSREMPAHILILATEEIRRQLLRQLAQPQRQVIIVTPFLQDVEMCAGRTLQAFVAQQVRAGTEFELFTTPPGLTAGNSDFRRKYTLLETLSFLGVKVLLNKCLHAK